MAIAGLLETIVGELRPLALEKQQQLELILEPQSKQVRGDATRIRQILINIIANAIKFTGAGGSIQVTLVTTTTATPLRVEVSDTGEGIASEKLDLIFEMFTQADQSSAREHEGSGVGLALSRRLARGMGFELTAVSELAHGSTFSLVFATEEPSPTG